jgi:hypothetical protein
MGLAIFNTGSHAAINATQNDAFVQVPKSSTFKRLFKHLSRQWQGANLDRKWLWHADDDSFMTHSVSKRVWRRHSALLVYARSHGAASDAVMNRSRIVRK